MTERKINDLKSPNFLVIVLLAFLIWPYICLLFSPCQYIQACSTGNNSLCIAFSYILIFHICQFPITPIVLAVFYFDTDIFPQKCLNDRLLQHSFAFLHTFSLWLLDNDIGQESTRKLPCLFVYPNRQGQNVTSVDLQYFLWKQRVKPSTFYSSSKIHPARLQRQYLYFHSTRPTSTVENVSKVT